ncbi:MAG: serine hydrolase [Candidatus Aminicenantes bacterium]|nr:serine hydrolase [Candidatus Aminicenantes bacterium]
MKHSRIFLTRVTFILIVVSFLEFNSQNLYAFQAYPHSEITDKVDALFAQWDKVDSPGAAVGIFKDGRIIYARGYGMANLEYNIPNTPQTVFRIGSTSKHFTAMCIALLIEKKKITDGDDIRLYIPELLKYGKAITIGNMLHHTSGFRNYEALMELAGRDGDTIKVPFYTDKDALDMIVRQKKLNFSPGERYSYSNTNYFLLAEMVGRVSGMKTSDFAKKYMFEPLEMQSTHFHDDINVIVKNRASGYSPKEGGGFRINMTQLEQIGTGSIYTTIEDLFKWDQNFYNNKLGLGRQSLIKMVETPGALNNGVDIEYGFGLDVGAFYGLKLISHGGSFVGFRSYYMRFPDQRFSIVILANQGPFPDYEIAGNIAILYLQDLFTEPLDKKQRTYRDREERSSLQRIQLMPKQLEQYNGVYYSEELDAYYTLYTEANNLIMRVGRYYTAPLESVSLDEFRWNYGNVFFNRNSSGNVSGFFLNQDLIRDLDFRKIK